MIEPHVRECPGWFGHLHLDVGVALEWRRLISRHGIQPVDLASRQGGRRGGGIAERLPFDTIEMGYLGTGGIAEGPSLRGT